MKKDIVYTLLFGYREPDEFVMLTIFTSFRYRGFPNRMNGSLICVRGVTDHSPW